MKNEFLLAKITSYGFFWEDRQMKSMFIECFWTPHVIDKEKIDKYQALFEQSLEYICILKYSFVL